MISASTSLTCSRVGHIAGTLSTALSRRCQMASTHSKSPSTAPVHLCVFAPTPLELRTTKDAILSAPSLLDTNSLPVELSFCDTADEEAPVRSDFNARSYFSFVNTRHLGRTLFTASTTPSTQSFLQQNVTKLPNGVVFVADQQSGGKGRGGNVWQSPKGCLMFSALTQLNISGQHLPFVQYLVTMAVVKALKEETRLVLGLDRESQHLESAEPALDIRIKWPNDVYAKHGSLKIGGVLCNSSFRQGIFHLIMGVGLNLLNRNPTTCLDSLIREQNACQAVDDARPVQPERVLGNILTHLEPMLDRLCEHGFASFEEEYYSLWLHSGQHVAVEGVPMKIVGLSDQGYLLAEDEHSNRHELHPDGNSLDFFKGLIRKKVAV